MTELERKEKRLQRRYSRGFSFFLFLTVLFVFGISLTVRYTLLEPVRVTDASMVPAYNEGAVVWICKLPSCIDQTSINDFVWMHKKNGESMVRKVVAMPGDTVEIHHNGKFKSSNVEFRWKMESSFIQNRRFYIPKAGDVLQFDKLNDVEQDYVIAYLQNRGEKVQVKTSLWLGDKELPLDKVGAAKIANRQVSLHEINFLPWQDRYLIGLQVSQNESGNIPVTLKRKLYHVRDLKDGASTTPSADVYSAKKTSADSVADTVAKDSVALPPPKAAPKPEEPSEPQQPELLDEITEISITEDCYYVACEKGNNCPDSREFGYITGEQMLGRYVEWPNKVKKVISPVAHHAKRGARIIKNFVTSHLPD